MIRSAIDRKDSGEMPYKPFSARKLFLQFLEQSQWWPAGQVHDFQFARMRRLFVHAFDSVPFYRRRFEKAGLLPEEICPDNWHNIPILKREDLQGRELLSRAVPPQHGKTGSIRTSGSTGQPVRVYTTQRMNTVWEAITVRDHLWHKRDFSGKLAVIRYDPAADAPPGGRLSKQWGPATSHVRTGPSVMLGVKFDTEHQLEWLVRHDPDYLLTYPSNLKALLERSEASGKRPPRLREVRTISEMVPSGLRDACRSVWGARLVDAYSAQEVGYIALQCPECDSYHVQAENVFVEVLDGADRPCRPGETGRLVITSLHNYATPLIRYEIGDYAEVGESCTCGRGLPVLERIVGRQRNMLVLPNGERRWPETGSMKFDKIIRFTQFQMVQHSPEEIELKLVVPDPVSREQENELVRIIRQSLGYPFNITFSYHDKIPRSAGGKYEDFKSDIA